VIEYMLALHPSWAVVLWKNYSSGYTVVSIQ